ncbi:hypothetical protein JCM1841_001363 [Sporobolomyces salmonicolor]
MPAVEPTQAALSFASGSQSPQNLYDIQAKPLELARTWCAALKAVDVTAEHKEQLLRTMRVGRLPEVRAFDALLLKSIHAELQGHERILRDVTPLLLDPSLRLQAAGCLLQYTSAASLPTLRDHLTVLTSTIIRALSPLGHTIHSASAPSSLSRFVSTCLRILNAIALKLLPLPQDVVDSVAAILGIWAYHRPGSVGTASPAPDRGRGAGQGQLAFGVMSAFSQPPAISRKGHPSSVSSSRSSSVGREGLSESEDEGGRRDRRVEFAQIRLDALTCLRSLATNSPKALHKDWQLFLSDSPYLRNRPTLVNLIESDSSRSVRLQACAALEAMLEDSASYLAIAQDRPTKASFTSLSTKIGETVSELHLSLASILAAPVAVGQTELRLAVLRLATTLASNSPYGRLKRPLARLLARAIVLSLASPDPSHVLPAIAALKAVVDRYVSTSCSQPFEWVDTIFITSSIASQHPSANVQAASLLLLASIVPAALDYDCDLDYDNLIALIQRAVKLLRNEPTDEKTRISALRILGSLVKLSAFSRLLDEDALPDSVLQAFEHALRDGRAKVRWNAATALSNALASSFPVATSPVAFSSVFDRLLTLVSDDPSFKVRIHAVSALLSVFQLPLLQHSETDRAAAVAVKARQLLAKQLEDGAVPAKERRHAEVLVKRLGTLVARLDELSQTASAA